MTRAFLRPRTVFRALAVTLFVGLFGLLVAQPAHAAGEQFKWKDYRTIEVSGGDLKGTSILTLTNDQDDGNRDAIFSGQLLYDKDHGDNLGCTIGIELYLFKADGNAGGRAWNPPPYGGNIAKPQGSPADCTNAGFENFDKDIHDKWFAISGTRPANPDGDPERPEEKTAEIDILAPDPQSKAPITVTITLKQGDKVIATKTVPFEDDSGASTWPPDQNPVRAEAVFENLEPGVYIVCDNYVIPDCETFTKEKYKAFYGEYGKQFVTPEKKIIEGHIDYHTIRPCNSTITVLPITVYLKKPDGKIVTKQTESKTLYPGENEKDGDCNVNQIVGLDVVFEDMPPGEYEACATAAPCVKFVKKPTEKAEFTLKVETTLQPPEDQKVCSSGEGIAGALAIYMCPFTEIVAKSSEFFEKNIIIPFMTISPLTTNADNPIYILWQSFRNLANIGFIIFFFFIIFSQATSLGISQYGLKRMLSRVFLVVVGVNLSYFLVALVIDAFNIFGTGTSDLVTAAIKQASVTVNTGTGSTGLQSIFVLGGTALLAIILTGGGVLGWLFSLIMLAALIIAIVIMVLLLRQVVIIMLVILAPIAILLYMLPNTENYFQKWRKTLIQLLLMYPMIVLLFASGKIFGMILQQPGLIQTGGAISEETAEAIRIILQFVAYILPLAFLPATFAASGTLMAKGYSLAASRFVQPRAQRAREDASQMGAEARARLANSRIPGVGWAAGHKYRRDYTRESRGRAVQDAQNEVLAGQMGATGFMGNMRRRRAAGVGGQTGQTRAAATAAGITQKALTESLQAESALLKQKMQEIGMDEDTFAEKTAAYLEDPTNQANHIITGSNGKTFNLAANAQKLQGAMLNSAASQGYIRAIEAARLNTDIDQNVVDEIIRRNDGTLKGKGGYHLATNFSLAAGRMQVRDQATGDLRAPANRHEMDTEMKAQRLIAMSQTGLDSIAGMKTSTVADSAHILSTPGAQRDDILRALDLASAAETASRRRNDPSAAAVDYRATLRGKMDDMLNPRMAQTLAQSDNDRQDFVNIRNGL